MYVTTWIAILYLFSTCLIEVKYSGEVLSKCRIFSSKVRSLSNNDRVLSEKKTRAQSFEYSIIVTDKETSISDRGWAYDVHVQ